MSVETQIARFEELTLDCGEVLAPVEVAYETYGSLDDENANAVLILHAFSGTRTPRALAAATVSRAGGTT